jgi:hypothetical protein
VAPAEAERVAELASGAPGAAVTLAQDTAAAESLAELDQAARMALSSGLFERLVLAKKLIDQKVDLMALAGRLQRALVAGLNTGTSSADTAPRLVALERFRRSLVANVSSRVALERLMLELEHA